MRQRFGGDVAFGERGKQLVRGEVDHGWWKPTGCNPWAWRRKLIPAPPARRRSRRGGRGRWPALRQRSATGLARRRERRFGLAAGAPAARRRRSGLLAAGGRNRGWR